MRKLSLLRHLPSLLGVVALIALSGAALALADTIFGDANSVTTSIEGSVEKAPGSAGTGEFALVVNDNALDPENGCNAGGNTSGTGGGKPPVVLNVSSNKSWLTVTPSTIQLTGCDSGNLSDLSPAASVTYSVAADAPGNDTATVTASYQSGGAAGGTYSSGSFQVRTPVPADTTPPNITANVAGTQGDNGWYTSAVAVDFTVTDAESTISSQSAACSGGSVTSDTAGTTFTCTATSAGGTASKSVTIKRDATAPSINLRQAGDSCDVPGSNGWCRGEQTAGFTASDPMSGLVAGSSPHNFTRSTSDNGSAVKISSGTFTDHAGNEAAAIDAGPFKIDSVEPTISGSASPAPNLAGWNNGDVDVTFECSDPNGSGVASCGPDQSLEGEGRGQSVTGNATDEAGNGASDTVSGIDIDRTAPSAPLASFDKPKAYTDGDGDDWYKDSVTVSFGGSTDPELDDDRADAADKSGSGVKGYSPDASRITTGTLSYSGTATDNADNESGAVSGSVEVDAADPLLQTSGCPTAAVVLGTPQALSVSASDGESGLATDGDPSGTLPLDTSSVGSKSVTLEAKDNVGHVVESTCSYRVIWEFTGFLAPIDNPVTGKMNGVKAGSSVPVKFKLGGYQGMNVLVAGYPKSTEFPCGTTPVDVVPDEAALFAASNSGLSYDLVSDQYSYVWKTDKLWAGKCRQLVLKFADGESRFVNFKAMK